VGFTESKERHSSNKERDRRIEKLQAEQEKRLRQALGNKLFAWVERFDADLGVELPE